MGTFIRSAQKKPAHPSGLKHNMLKTQTSVQDTTALFLELRIKLQLGF